MKSMNLIAASLFVVAISSQAASLAGGGEKHPERGSTPSIPCYKDGKMISTNMLITQCKKIGGSIYPDGRR